MRGINAFKAAENEYKTYPIYFASDYKAKSYSESLKYNYLDAARKLKERINGHMDESNKR